MKNFPKISIVTPSYNQNHFLERTIQSILSQNYPNLEYIIIDGGSSDGSIETIKKYEDQLSYWISESDKGLYDAINKGFKQSTGEIMGWLNSDDILHKEALYTLAEVFSLNNINWVQGKPSFIDEKDRIFKVSDRKKWSKYDFWIGNNGWIQQESTYWSRKLWEQSGAYINTDYKLAGDFELWDRFFRYEKLYSLDCLIGAFRTRSSNQLSLDKMDDYLIEVNKILSIPKLDESIIKTLNKIKRLRSLLKKLNSYKTLRYSPFYAMIKSKIIKLSSYPPDITFDRVSQNFRISNKD